MLNFQKFSLYSFSVLFFKKSGTDRILLGNVRINKMKLGIMQPYFFPYIGYFQLIKAIHRFIAYDDVTYIKGGWINRNRMLANGKPLLFSVPLSGASPNKLIRDVHIDKVSYNAWCRNFFKTLEQYYHQAPEYENVLPIIKDVLACNAQTISVLAIHSIKAICAYLGITTEIVETATNYNNSHLKAEDRIIDICRQESAQIYVNAAGGRELYFYDNFKENGIYLKFLRSQDISYKQGKNPFVPWLSIIDVIMFNTPETVHELLDQYELV
jgi:hypothetical protein